MALPKPNWEVIGNQLPAMYEGVNSGYTTQLQYQNAAKPLANRPGFLPSYRRLNPYATMDPAIFNPGMTLQQRLLQKKKLALRNMMNAQYKQGFGQFIDSMALSKPKGEQESSGGLFG